MIHKLNLTSKMTDQQLTHVGILNSYNLLVGNATFDEIVESNVALFAHLPDESVDIEFVRFLINYFQGLEMYENCSVLNMYIRDNFDSDGTYIDRRERCECEYPIVAVYTKNTKCEECKKQLR